jgi:hypothetical protein
MPLFLLIHYELHRQKSLSNADAKFSILGFALQLYLYARRVCLDLPSSERAPKRITLGFMASAGQMAFHRCLQSRGRTLHGFFPMVDGKTLLKGADQAF